MISFDHRQPMISEMTRWGDFCVSCEMKIINLPYYYNFTDIRLTPSQVRDSLNNMGNRNVIAFQTRNPMHRIHEEITKRAVKEVSGSLLIHPAVGMAKPGDVDYYTRVRIYKALFENYYDPSHTILSLIPIAMRTAGPREAL